MWNLLFRGERKNRPARVPDGFRLYVVGDVHGRADLLKQLLSVIDADVAARPIARPIRIFLGDYVDRGRESKEVLDVLVEYGERHEVVFLKGNHETYVFEFLKTPEILVEWRQLGGTETLLSYGVKLSLNLDDSEGKAIAETFNSLLPESHRQFLNKLKLSFSCGDFFFAHAGVRPGVPLALQKEEDLLWIRNDFLSSNNYFGKIVVHGHTPVDEPEFLSNRINIDTGAYATGRLTCLRIENESVLFFAGRHAEARRVYVPSDLD